MKWRPSLPQLIRAFEEVVPGPPAVQRKMFGYPAGFVNGNMFMGLFEDQMVLRLSEDARGELLSVKGAKPFEPMAGRPMREYVVVPSAIVGDRARLSAWVGKALAYGASLKPKATAKGGKSRARPPARAKSARTSRSSGRKSE